MKIGDKVKIKGFIGQFEIINFDMLTDMYLLKSTTGDQQWSVRYKLQLIENSKTYKGPQCPVSNEKGTVFKDAEVQRKVGILKEFIKCGPDITPPDIYHIAICECGASSLGYNTHADYCPKRGF